MTLGKTAATAAGVVLVIALGGCSQSKATHVQAASAEPPSGSGLAHTPFGVQGPALKCHPGESVGQMALARSSDAVGFPTPRAALDSVLRHYPLINAAMFTEGNGSDHALGPVFYVARGDKGEVRMVVTADQVSAPDAAGQHWLAQESDCNEFANRGVR